MMTVSRMVPPVSFHKMADQKVTEELASYCEALKDLNQNSKPHINMLTMLAEENFHHGREVAQAIKDHIFQVFIR